MRKDWEVKKLGDICLSKSAIKRAKDVYSGDSEISYIDISSIDNHRNLICNINTLRFQNAPSRAQQCVEKNDILVSLVRPNLKNIAQIDFDHNSMVASSGFCVLRVKDDIINSYFLRYYLLSDSFVIYLMNNINGINYPAVKEIDVKSYVLKIPPLQTQQQIVEELDCLTSIIEKQKKQLEELDNLAQSIFYDMFGDPIENEKGWGKEKITKVAPIEPYQGDIPEMNGMYWLLNLDMIQSNKRTIYEKVYVQYDEVGTSTIKFNKDNVLYSKLRPYLNKVVIPDESGFCTSELVPFKPNESIILKIFLCYVLSHKGFVDYINSKVIGAKMPRVSMNVLREFNVITPPLPLQQQFAAKIEAIEKQKELIKKSIKETEDLFNSRMDYYFN